MKKVKLGGTGLTVSEVGFGGIPIIPLPLEEGAEVVRHCYDLGITFFDTANVYGDSEKKVGKALCDVRDKVVIATKTLRRDAETAEKHIRQSLQNLETDRIDIYQLHNVSNDATLAQVLAPDGAYRAAEKARKDGTVRFIGFSSHNVKFAAGVCRRGLFSTVQIPFNFIETEAAEDLFGVAAEMGMGVIGMKPLGGGLLQRPDLCMKFLQQYPQVDPESGCDLEGGDGRDRGPVSKNGGSSPRRIVPTWTRSGPNWERGSVTAAATACRAKRGSVSPRHWASSPS